MRFRTTCGTLVAVAALALAGCSSDDPSSGDSTDTSSFGPCDLLRPDEAAELLGGPVEQIDFAEYLAASSTVPAEDQAKVDAAAERICMYRAKPGEATASLQLDRGLFDSEAEFRSAFGPDVEPLDDPGLAANYQARAGDDITHFGVLLNEDGDSFDLRVSGEPKSEAEMKRTATAIVDRY